MQGLSRSQVSRPAYALRLRVCAPRMLRCGSYFAATKSAFAPSLLPMTPFEAKSAI